MRGDHAVAEVFAGQVSELIHRLGLPDHCAAGGIADGFQIAVGVVVTPDINTCGIGDGADPSDIKLGQARFRFLKQPIVKPDPV